MEGIGKSNMISLQAKKETGLGDLFKDYTPQQLEEQKEIPLSSVYQQLGPLLEKYQHVLETDFGRDFTAPHTYPLFDRIKKIFTEQLSPAQINLFLQATLPYESHKHYSLNAHIISSLIQESYDAGYNDFRFMLGSLFQMQYFPMFLLGRLANPLCVTLSGHTPLQPFSSCQYVTGIIQADAYALGAGSMDSTFILKGSDLGALGLGMSTEYVGQQREKHTSRCNFIIEGEIAQSPSPRLHKCLVEVYNQEAAEQLRRTVDPSNQIILGTKQPEENKK